MGDKGKPAGAGHLPEHYNLKIRFIEAMINKYKESRLPELLWLFPNQDLPIRIPRRQDPKARTGTRKTQETAIPRVETWVMIALAC
jgi:hypothetical protein